MFLETSNMVMDANPACENSLAKRMLDRFVGSVLLLVAAPVIGSAALLVILEDRANPFFSQRRAGQNGRAFLLWKLRSMPVNVPPPAAIGQVLSDSVHLTRVGQILRRTKVDELPQLLNVVIGDMSLVGPRPALPEQAAAYGPAERERLVARPGMTGWAQVNGNIHLSWEDRIALDRWYVRHWSFWLDLRILLRTFGVVIHGERISTTALEEAKKC